MTGNECCRCGRRVACPHCDTREAATVSDLRDKLLIWRNDGNWFADDGMHPGFWIGNNAGIEVAPADIPALCEALRLVPRAIVVDALDRCMAEVSGALKDVNRSFTEAITIIMWDGDEPEPAEEAQR